MKAALLTAVDAPLEIADLRVDDPSPHEVRIRTVAAGVCHSDVHFQEGKYDHVITCVSMSCGHCRQCMKGRPHLCSKDGLLRAEGAAPRLSNDAGPVHQFMELSCYAEEMLVHEKAVVKVTKDIPLERAALIGCSVVTGVGAVTNTAGVSPGETVVVVGCGGIGLNAIQGARLAGAERIIAVDRLPSKLPLATDFGATDTVDASAVDAVATVHELTGGGADHAIEAVGLKETAEQCFSMVGMGGTATVIGMIPIGTKLEIQGVELLGEKKLQGSVMGSTRFRLDMPMYINLYLQGRLKLDELVSRTIGLSEINDAFDALRKGEVARSVIRMAG
jgi:S-(hydroxymethyl)glutathione dehydrogenase/alcohol dehydrogenase